VSRFPFVLNGFGEIDAAKIAVSVIDMLKNGPNAAFSSYYFTGVIPLYIFYLQSWMKLLDYNYSYLPVVMNYTNVVFGILIVIPAFYLLMKLFRSTIVAFCTVLALIFAPSFYQATIMGFPHLIAFFFLLVSLCFYLSGLDHSQRGKVYFSMFLSCLFLTVAFLFKSDYVLASGVYIGFLFIRKINDRKKISSAFLIVLISGILFFLFRHLILGPGSGATMSKEGMAKWYDYSLAIPTNPAYLIRQVKPIAYGAGLFTFFLGILSLVYHIVKRRLDVLVFIVSWAAVPTVFWIVMIGNNARHNMLTILPVLAIIIILFNEIKPKYTVLLTLLLIIGNFSVTAPSSSILTPSGRLFKSQSMVKERMERFRSSARQIANINAGKIAVLGYFHNPHVIFEIMKSSSSYKAFKIGREDYKIITGKREFIFLYFAVKPENIVEEIKYFMNKYDINDYLFVSATYDLRPLRDLGLKTVNVNIIKKSEL
jgi:hypothetical protein